MQPTADGVSSALEWIRPEYPRACSGYGTDAGLARLIAALTGLSDADLRNAVMQVVRCGLPRGLGLVAALRQAAFGDGGGASGGSSNAPPGMRLPTEAEELQCRDLRLADQLRLRPDGWWVWCAKRDAWRPSDIHGKHDVRAPGQAPKSRPQERPDWRTERAMWGDHRWAGELARPPSQSGNPPPIAACLPAIRRPALEVPSVGPDRQPPALPAASGAKAHPETAGQQPMWGQDRAMAGDP